MTWSRICLGAALATIAACSLSRPAYPFGWSVATVVGLAKCGHLAGYGLVGFCLARMMRRPWSWSRSVVLPVTLTLIVAGADEFHQQYVPGRHGCLADIGLDTVGALLGVSMYWTLQSSRVFLASMSRRRLLLWW